MPGKSAPTVIVFLLLLALAMFWWGLGGAGGDAANGGSLPNPGCSIDWGEAGEPLPGGLRVHFIDVGQGDAILIQTPEQNMLIDGGERGPAAVDYLQSQDVTGLDLVIGTHPHSDHIGGLINVLQLIPVKEVIDPGAVHSTKTFEDYLTLIDEKEIKFTEGRAGMKRDLGGGVSMEILHPLSLSFSELNNASIVACLIFGRISFLFTGDAEGAAEEEMLQRGCTLAGTILKVGHHGSKSSSTQDFLEAVKPEVAVIMCGEDNSYGCLHEETLSRLSRTGADLYRTDKQGTIIIETDGDTYRVNKQPWRDRS